MMNELDRDVARKRKQRIKGREVIVPPCANPGRRLELEEDDEAWLRYYFPEMFWYAFVGQQKEMITAISRALVEGGDQSLAASRGEGKSKIAERVLMKHTFKGRIGFSVLFAATGSAAQDSLQSVMAEIETNDRLHEDYPEICVPVRALGGSPNRAGGMLVTGQRHDNGEAYKRARAKFRWCGQEIFLPNVPGSPAANAIFATRGLEATVRGLNKLGRRPDVAVLDDPDTEETALSADLAHKLEKRIDRAIAGLGGQKRNVARVMLTTIQNRSCVSFKFTDEQQKPSWRPKRFRFLITPPTAAGLWSEYVDLRRQDWREGTEHAAKLYEDKRAEMDAGAEVANPNRYTETQISALQFYYDQVARLGAEAVATEYDNDPPEEEAGHESDLTPGRIQRQVSGLKRGVIPDTATVLTHTVDVNKRYLHWVVRAWIPGATGHTIDYGTTRVHGTKYKSDEGLDQAIRNAIKRRMEEFQAANYTRENGSTIADPLTLIDAGWRTDAVYSACLTIRRNIYPVMGFGKSNGCAGPSFTPGRKATATNKPGDRWNLVKKGNVWLVEIDADHWKNFEHDRWLASPDSTGCLLVFGEPSGDERRMSEDERGHLDYGSHICAEVEVEEIYKGHLRKRWKSNTSDNHWLDSSAYGDVAANMKGIRLDGPAYARTPETMPTNANDGRRPPEDRPSLADLAGQQP